MPLTLHVLLDYTLLTQQTNFLIYPTLKIKLSFLQLKNNTTMPHLQTNSYLYKLCIHSISYGENERNTHIQLSYKCCATYKNLGRNNLSPPSLPTIYNTKRSTILSNCSRALTIQNRSLCIIRSKTRIDLFYLYKEACIYHKKGSLVYIPA